MVTRNVFVKPLRVIGTRLPPLSFTAVQAYFCQLPVEETPYRPINEVVWLVVPKPLVTKATLPASATEPPSPRAWRTYILNMPAGYVLVSFAQFAARVDPIAESGPPCCFARGTAVAASLASP